MTWRVVVADRVAGSGLELLSRTPDIEVVDVAGKPAELDKAIAGAHALIVRSETRVTASLMARAPPSTSWRTQVGPARARVRSSTV